MTSHRSRRANDKVTLQWHGAATTLNVEAFRHWSLVLLKGRIRFDGAIWGALDRGENGRPDRIVDAYVDQVSAPAWEDFERTWATRLVQRATATSVMNLCLADLAWQEPRNEVQHAYARRHAMMNMLVVRHQVPDAIGEQFVLLVRKAVAHRFTSEELADFESLAPHAMQAYATCRRFLLERAERGDRRASGVATAMIDRHGLVLEAQPQFRDMLRREWSDWPGDRLPEVLLDLVARRGSSKWRFGGDQVTADFLPVNELCLVTARARHVVDALTEREAEVATLYAAGGNFREVAESLNLAPATVRAHLRNVFSKLQVRTKTALSKALQR